MTPSHMNQYSFEIPTIPPSRLKAGRFQVILIGLTSLLFLISLFF